jgi:hypothetical protein
MRLRLLYSQFAILLLAVAFSGERANAGWVPGSDQIADGRVTVRRCPDSGTPVCARITNDGAIHLLYDLGGLTWYTVSRDGGKTFEKAICTVDPDSRKPGLEFSGADMSANNSGQVFVAMSTNAWKLKLPQNEWSLHYATLIPGARAFSPVWNLNDKSSEGFSLASDDGGNVVAAWLSEKLYANFSRDGGKTFSPNAEISKDCDPCPCCTTSSVFGANGDLAVLYREEAGNNRDMYVLIRHRDGRISRKRISSTLWNIDACPMSCFTISRAGDGYVAAWPTRGQVFFVKLDKDGNQLTLIGWQHRGRLNWQFYSATGRPVGSEGSTTEDGKWAVGVVLADSRVVLFQ